MVLDAGIPMLFNLKTDPGERENLVGREHTVAKRLFQLYTAWEGDVMAEARRR